MMKRLPPFMRGSALYKTLFDTSAAQLAIRDVKIANITAQLSVDTATWALSIYETELGIPVETSKPASERRSVIKSRMRGTGKVDAALIRLVANSWTNGGAAVSFSDGRITVTFNDVIGVPENIEDVKRAIEEVKPAHLAVEYVFLFNTWKDAATKTWGELNNYTWGQVMSGDIF
ncbi:putative phage tail protein [Paenibacillus aurantiacus]|uniref:Phage tail protein n=1 Tax=Paenibacillus aurantiacus TaxID=1936118 RepID=A0ABV5KP76_9BACL